MIILDTNVFSALMREVPDQAVLAWMDQQPDSSLWTTTVTLMELQYGLKILPLGRRRQKMREELEAVLREEIEGRYVDLISLRQRKLQK
jgi:predicted nucleic acid-binding protein